MSGYALLLAAACVGGCGIVGASLGTLYVLARALHDY